jgi:IS5 family transposase
MKILIQAIIAGRAVHRHRKRQKLKIPKIAHRQGVVLFSLHLKRKRGKDFSSLMAPTE